MFDVYAAGKVGVHCHSTVCYIEKKMLQRYIDAVHFRNIGVIKHFMAYLVESFGHPGGDLKEIESEILNLELKVCCCRVSQFCFRNFLNPISDAALPGLLPQIRQRTQIFPR